MFFIIAYESVKSVTILTSEDVLKKKFFVDVFRGELEFLR